MTWVVSENGHISWNYIHDTNFWLMMQRYIKYWVIHTNREWIQKYYFLLNYNENRSLKKIWRIMVYLIFWRVCDFLANYGICKGSCAASMKDKIFFQPCYVYRRRLIEFIQIRHIRGWNFFFTILFKCGPTPMWEIWSISVKLISI